MCCTMPPLHTVEGFALVLKLCKRFKDPPCLLLLLVYARASGQESHHELGNRLVSALADQGCLCLAEKIFHKLQCYEILSRDCIIHGYINSECLQQALDFYNQIESVHSEFGGLTFVALLKACSKLKDLETCCKVNVKIDKQSLLGKNIYITGTLIDCYMKCGSLAKAREIFEKLPVRNVILSTILISGLAVHGHYEEALTYYKRMRKEGADMDAGLFVCVLKACANIGEVRNGYEVHNEIVERGVEEDLSVGNSLVDVYSKCGYLSEAQTIFEKLLLRDVVSWNALIAGFMEYNFQAIALACFEMMQYEGIHPSVVTLVCVLKAYGNMRKIDKARDMHGGIIKQGFLDSDVFIGSSLVDTYAKCAFIEESQKVFDELPIKDVVSWNVLISGYVNLNRGEEALHCFEQMQLNTVVPDITTYVSALKACAMVEGIEKCCKLHDDIIDKGLESEAVIVSSLVDIYCKFGFFQRAEDLLGKLETRDPVMFNALITGYEGHGHHKKVLMCYMQMLRDGITPDEITLICCLQACGNLGYMVKGQRIHFEVVCRGLESELSMGSTVAALYIKCGSPTDAQEIFDKLPLRNVVSWTALITGLTQLGGEECLSQSSDRMTEEVTDPDLVAFLNVLSVCSHVGLVDKGQAYFTDIHGEYGFVPTCEHFLCVIDILGRAGHVEKVASIIQSMPFHPTIVAWHTVQGVCQKWGDVKLGEYAFENALALHDNNPATCIAMCNIYSNANHSESS